MKDVHNILLLFALGIYTGKEVCQHSHSMIQFWFTQYATYTAIYCPTQYIDMPK